MSSHSYILYTRRGSASFFLAAGSYIIMRLFCYRTCADYATQEQLWLCAEYVHAISVEPYAEFYIREDRLSLALLIDPLMVHVNKKDMIL